MYSHNQKKKKERKILEQSITGHNSQEGDDEVILSTRAEIKFRAMLPSDKLSSCRIQISATTCIGNFEQRKEVKAHLKYL